VESLARQYVEAMVPDAAEVVAALGFEKIDVRIMSGGLRPAVLAVARWLGIRRTGLRRSTFVLTRTGEYAGFDAFAAGTCGRQARGHAAVAQRRSAGRS
jgi:phosphoserine phosphatase